ncbi:peptidyl-tRNA hydrolase Pth2 [Candidatus Woesearchaeota archaeon]|nr:peptidyl-tRNA hydrolase Pth2 [Candidatus Woesearchaeota archaeon]
MDYKQVIIVRSDLKMAKGKLSSQVAHASVESVLKSDKSMVEKWRDQGMPKIILKVSNLRELVDLKKQAQKNKLVTALITDSGLTYFKEPTTTCLALGPDLEEEIDKVTSKLKML